MKRSLVVSLFFLLAASPAFATDSPLALATADGPPLSYPDHSGFHDRIIREAFSRNDTSVEIVHLPAERALINADQGIEDGVYVRVAGMEALYPNLVRVPEKITDYEFVVFTKTAEFSPDDWDNLKPYEVGIITGWKILERNIRDTRELLKVDTPAQLFGVLERDRVEIVVYNRYDGYGVLHQLRLNGIRVLEPPLAVREMFLYLHRKHARMAPDLAEALRAIKSDGTYSRLFQEIIAPLAPQ